MTSLLRCNVYIEHSQSVQYFVHSFTTCQVLDTIASYKYQNKKLHYYEEHSASVMLSWHTLYHFFGKIC